MSFDPLVALAGIGLLVLFSQLLAWWLKLPAILFLLLFGIIVGPLLGWLEPAQLFGDLLFPFISLAVAVILFEGSLTLRFEEIKGLGRVVQRLVSVGVLVTCCVTAIVTHYLIGLTWPLALLFGAITSVTGPTVIVPMLRSVRPNSNISNILRWEGIVIDPIGALLAVLIFEFIISGISGTAIEHTLLLFGKILLTGSVLGIGSGYLLGIIIRHHLLPEYLHNVTTLAVLFAFFALSNTLAEESGLLTVTVMGIWLANMRDVHIEEILDFKENLSLILISVLFIILAARMEFSQFSQLGWAAVTVFLAIQFLARPAKVMAATWGSSLNWRERALLSWIAPRGIVAAAISAIFQLRLVEQGFEQAELLVPLTFLVIICTVILQSATARPLAKALRVAEPEASGFLIIGANIVARTIGKALHQHGYSVLLADTYWDHISAARMEGLKTFYGNPLSLYADRHLDLIGIGQLLALSPRDDVNALATLRYRSEFGRNAVYSLSPAKTEDEGNHNRRAIQLFGKQLFSADATYARLSNLINSKAEITATTLSGDFGYSAWQELNQGEVYPLFAITPKNQLRLFTPDARFKVDSGWTIVSLGIKAEKNTFQEANANTSVSNSD